MDEDLVEGEPGSGDLAGNPEPETQPEVQFGDPNYVETETYQGTDELVTRRDDGSIVYDGDADYNEFFQETAPAAPATPAAVPAEPATPPASIATLQPILTEAERAFFQENPDRWLEAQELIAQRVAARSETSILASDASLSRLNQQAPELMNIVGPAVRQNLAQLTPELRVREDAADIALLMAVQNEAIRTKTSAFDVMKRYVTVGEKKPVTPPRAPAAPTHAVRRMPGASPNVAPRQTSRQRPTQTVGAGLGLSEREQRILQDDPEGLIF